MKMLTIFLNTQVPLTSTITARLNFLPTNLLVGREERAKINIYIPLPIWTSVIL